MNSCLYNAYLQCIQTTYPAITADTLSQIAVILENTSWDNPVSSADWNNQAVVALSEAEQCSDNLDMRSVYLEMAIQALNNGLNIDRHPLCAAHLALIHSMIGETQESINIAINTFINSLQFPQKYEDNNFQFLVYIHNTNISNIDDSSYIETLFKTKNSYQQAILLSTEVLCRSQLVFYNAVGRRFLHLAAQLLPQSVDIGLRLGISSLMSGEWEGLFYLHRARELAPHCTSVLQALHLAYRDLNQLQIADSLLEVAKSFYQQNPQSPDWYWTQLPGDSKFTYVPFENNLIMAVEPSFRSIVTGVLIAEKKWFEKEMEFWRNFIKPGMTVIDVGANVGVYTFSAAMRVGAKGRLLAVEPFSGCVRCLQETCKINDLSWVTVCAGAASDHNGTLRLLLHSANELNEVISHSKAENMPSGKFEEVSCFTLDSLIEKENIEQVDIFKIDAENHEIAVLKGSSQILSKFAPVILYENIAGSKGSNYQVAEFLIKHGYKIFRYQPYLQNLIPVNSQEKMQNNLNLIALPSGSSFAV